MFDEICLGELTLLHSVYEYINSNMYVLVAEKEALIIDPHKNENLTDMLHSNGITDVTIILTHEHHDHTSGIYWYQCNFKSTLICQEKAAEAMARKQYLRPTLTSFILGEEDYKNGTHRYDEFKKVFVPRQYKADITFSDHFSLNWHNHTFLFYHIPGHSPGSSIILFDGKYVFTGDSLMKDLPVVIRFPGSNKDDYNNITMPLLCGLLNREMTILPGHGTPFVLKEIMEENQINVQFR